MTSRLSTEQTIHLRQVIAMITRARPDQITSQSRFVRDLGGTLEQLKELRLAIEPLFGIQIEPVDTAVNRRLAVDLQGVLTGASLEAVLQYLGEWPERPTGRVTLFDLLTVGMLEAMVAKAIAGVPPTTPRPGFQGELQATFYGIVAHTFDLSIQAVHPALDLFSLRDRPETWSDAVGDVIMAGKAAAGVELSLKWPEIATCIEYARAESASPQFRDACFAKLRQLVPDLDSDGDSATLTTVGFLERILCSAVSRREGPVVADKPRPPVFGYLAKWTWADQDWWLALPQTLGKDKFRLLLCGILREYYLTHGDAARNRALTAAEEYAQTGRSLEELATRRNALASWKGSSRYHAAVLWPAVDDECAPEACSFALEAFAKRHGGTPQDVAEAIRQWIPSLMCPLASGFEWNLQWFTPEVVALASQMNEMRIYVDFPKLGDLLEAAGCTELLILEHCRNAKCSHLRGDWLLEAIISRSSQTIELGTKTKSKKIPKPKKPKFVKLSSSAKRELKEHVETKMAGVPLATAWSIAFQPGTRDDTDYYRKEYSNASPEVPLFLARLYPALRTCFPSVAIARRIHLAQVDDLRTAMVLYARIELANWMTHLSLEKRFDTLLSAFVAHDPISIRNAAAELDFDERFPGDWSFEALRAIALRDDALIQRAADRGSSPSSHSLDLPTVMALLAILQRDAREFQKSLEMILNQERESPLTFGISLQGHGLYRVAQWRSPELVEGFNTQQEFPWDVEYHSACESPENLFKRIDWSNVPAPLSHYLQSGEISLPFREIHAVASRRRR